MSFIHNANLLFTALSGILFPGNEEAAFSVFRFIESIGSVAAYAISPLICMKVKLWIMIGIILLGIGGYSFVEYSDKEKGRERKAVPLVDIQDTIL